MGQAAAESLRWSRREYYLGWPLTSSRSMWRPPLKRPKPDYSGGLRKQCPGLPEILSLGKVSLPSAEGEVFRREEKVFIVLDQFEQWLHAKREQENTELVEALRQCDGGRVQCIVMVRDDFWMAVSPLHAGTGDPVGGRTELQCADRSFRPSTRQEGAGGIWSGFWQHCPRSPAKPAKNRRTS